MYVSLNPMFTLFKLIKVNRLNRVNKINHLFLEMREVSSQLKMIGSFLEMNLWVVSEPKILLGIARIKYGQLMVLNSFFKL